MGQARGRDCPRECRPQSWSRCMTGTKKLLKARHAKLVKEQEQKRAEVTEAISQLQELMTEIDNFERDLDRAFDWPKDKPLRPNQAQKLDRHERPTKYNRRPPKWKGRDGYELVSGVIAIQARDKCSVAAAIRELKKHDPKKWPQGGKGGRDLEQRYKEIKNYWRPWYQVEQMLEAEATALLAKTEL
jgi:hypothetical protein